MGHMLTKRLALSVFAMALAFGLYPGTALADVSSARADHAALAAQASSYKGLYEYKVGDPYSWGGATSTADPGYTLSLEILGKKGKVVTFKLSQDYFYGATGYYSVGSKVISVRLKGKTGSFTFDTNGGDRGKGKIRLVSKNKAKLSLSTTQPGRERMPLSTGGKFKTLKRAKYQYSLL